MKIAIPTKENNQIDNHFGHCQFYTIFMISDQNEIMAETQLPSPQGCGCKSDIAETLAAMDVQVMLAGGVGQGAINKLAAAGINVIRNCEGDVHQLVENYLAGKITDGGQNCSSHEHSCNH